MANVEPTIRLLNPDDATSFRALRVRSMREHPEAFTSDAQSVANEPLSVAQRQLERPPERPHDFVLGAQIGGDLVGMVGLLGRYRVHERHNATVVGMYVVPDFTRRGLGTGLLKTLIERARGFAELEQLDLTVTQGNMAPLRLYEKMGFTVFGVQPSASRINDQTFNDVLMARPLR